MKKLYRYTLGNIDRFGVANDTDEAHEKRAEVDHTFEFLPVQIEEVQIDGYTITVTKDDQEAEAPRQEAGAPRARGRKTAV
jgi:hypothetical protein